MSNSLCMTREQVLKIIKENKKDPIPVTYPIKVEFDQYYGYNRSKGRDPKRDTLIITFDVFNKKQIAKFISVGRSGYYHNEALDIMCVREEIYELSKNEFYRLYDGKDIVGEDFEYRVEKRSCPDNQLGIKTSTEVKFEIKELTEDFQSLRYSIKKFESLMEEVKEKRFSCKEAQFLFSPPQVLKFVTDQFYEIFANDRYRDYFIYDTSNYLFSLPKDYQRSWLIAEKNEEFKIIEVKGDENMPWEYQDLTGDIATKKLVCGKADDTLQLWLDYIHDLIELGEDIHNPKLLCPENIEEAHRETGRRIRNLLQKEELEKKLKRAEKFNASYIKNHKKWLDIVWETEDLIARPLQNVREFLEEGDHMCHCVFRCKYYKKANSLILSIRDKKTNKRLETAEVDMIQEKILQCYGYGDHFTDQHDNIIKFINKNLKDYVKENRDNESCRKLQGVKKEVK